MQIPVANLRTKLSSSSFSFYFGSPPQPYFYDVDTFIPSTSGNWKVASAKAVLSGPDYIDDLTESIVYINSFGIQASGADYLLRLVGVATDANPAILFYLHDTSRTASGDRAKLAKKNSG